MIKLVVTNEKNLELYELEKVHVGENKFGYYLIFLPEVLNGYNMSDCEVKLVQIFEDNTSVAIDVDTTQEVRPIKEFITLDATAQAQTVTLSVLITHNGDVIGKTNQKTYQVYPTKNATPIDPREDLDEIIAELRADNAQLEETVSEQSAEITEKNAQITELSNQVDDLTEETTEQAETIERQETTIDQLNSRVPKMYTPPIVTPSGSTQQITPPPDEDYDGLASVTVDRVTAAVDSDIIPENIKAGVDILGVEGTYNPFPEHSYGGIYYTELGEGGYPKKILIKDMLRSVSTIPQFFNTSNDAKRELREVVFENCPEFLEITTIFAGFNYLTKVILPNSLTVIGITAFQYCTSLMEIKIPDTLTSIGRQAFIYCTSLTKINLPQSLTSIDNNAFQYCTSLTNLTIAQGFNCNGLNVSFSTRFTAETIVSCLEALADRTGQTAYTITFGTKNLNKLTAEQKAIATNKNWNLA